MTKIIFATGLRDLRARFPQAARYDEPASLEPLPSAANLAENIAVLEIPLGEFEEGRIADSTNRASHDLATTGSRKNVPSVPRTQL